MIRYLTADRLQAHSALAQSMFRHRTLQFRDRLGWPVSVDADGGERDQYDGLNPLYVIVEDAEGRHAGSLRFLPTLGRTMLAEHFAALVPAPIRDADIWECTRFCVAPEAGPGVSAALMLGGLEAGLALGLTHAVGVFDAPMLRVYRSLGWPPQVLGRDKPGRGAICAGLWQFNADLRAGLAAKADLPQGRAAAWAAELRPVCPAA